MTSPKRLPLRWEAPPQPMTKAELFLEEWGLTALALMTREGEWAVLAEGLTPSHASGLASKIRRGDVEPFLNDGNGKFEASQYTDPAGAASGSSREVTVYARYVLFANN